ncbi:MAG TPA: MBL fold metallo-hydrolase, partial [Candidatus Polarisedimenticolia bacterium]|nr:MBL fold metallo-hydrolase [Candidatus Polarisedimenticolia bacterium]
IGNFRPAEVWGPSGAASWRPTRAVERMRQALLEAGISLHEVGRGGAVCLSGARIVPLNPPAAGSAMGGDNEGSMVLMIRASGRKALLMGDAGQEAETAIAGLLDAADLLKVGHHGSRSASSTPFLERVKPRVAVISCGHGNPFNHPHPDTLSRLERSRCRLWRTDRDGAVAVELLPRGTRVVTYGAAGGPPLRTRKGAE